MTPSTRSSQRGFTLLELAIAMAIVAILASIAYPTYSNYILRSHRVDAKIAITAAVQQLERYYTEHNSFTGASLGTGGVYPATSPNAYYTLSLTLDPTRSVILPTGSTYLLTASPSGAQTQDSQCGSYTQDETGFKTAAGKSDNSTLSQCW